MGASRWGGCYGATCRSVQRKKVSVPYKFNKATNSCAAFNGAQPRPRLPEDVVICQRWPHVVRTPVTLSPDNSPLVQDGSKPAFSSFCPLQRNEDFKELTHLIKYNEISSQYGRLLLAGALRTVLRSSSRAHSSFASFRSGTSSYRRPLGASCQAPRLVRSVRHANASSLATTATAATAPSSTPDAKGRAVRRCRLNTSAC